MLCAVLLYHELSTRQISSVIYYLEKINWTTLSSNINAISILEKNQDKIDWKILSGNPNIFCCDYDYYKKRMDIYREELMKKVFHPNRLIYYLEIGYDFADM